MNEFRALSSVLGITVCLPEAVWQQAMGFHSTQTRACCSPPGLEPGHSY